MATAASNSGWVQVAGLRVLCCSRTLGRADQLANHAGVGNDGDALAGVCDNNGLPGREAAAK